VLTKKRENEEERKAAQPFIHTLLKGFPLPFRPQVADRSAIPYSLFAPAVDNTCNAVNTSKSPVLWKKPNAYTQQEEENRKSKYSVF
jgi:hypothetical protein